MRKVSTEHEEKYLRRGARHDSVADTNGYEMPLDRQVLLGAQGYYGVGRGQLGQYPQAQRMVRGRGDDADGIWHHLGGESRRMSVGRLVQDV